MHFLSRSQMAPLNYSICCSAPSDGFGITLPHSIQVQSNQTICRAIAQDLGLPGHDQLKFLLVLLNYSCKARKGKGSSSQSSARLFTSTEPSPEKVSSHTLQPCSKSCGQPGFLTVFPHSLVSESRTSPSACPAAHLHSIHTPVSSIWNCPILADTPGQGMGL